MADLGAFPLPQAASALHKLLRQAQAEKLEKQLVFQLGTASIENPRLKGWVREFPYAKHLARRFRADIAYPDARLLIQVEGGIHNSGKHVRGKGFESDCERDALAVMLGYRVLRVTAKTIKSGEALKWIEACL